MALTHLVYASTMNQQQLSQMGSDNAHDMMRVPPYRRIFSNTKAQIAKRLEGRRYD